MIVRSVRVGASWLQSVTDSFLSILSIKFVKIIGWKKILSNSPDSVRRIQPPLMPPEAPTIRKLQIIGDRNSTVAKVAIPSTQRDKGLCRYLLQNHYNIVTSNDMAPLAFCIRFEKRSSGRVDSIEF